MAATLRTPLILCCAEENEVALVRVLDELHRDGLSPELLAGVDADGGLLTAAVDRTVGPALFVLCQSDELDRSATRRLSGLFSARKGPAHRILTVALAPARPLASLPAIRDALREMDGAPPPPAPAAEPAEDDRVLLRDVVGTTAVTAVREREQARVQQEEELAKDLHREMVAAEALLTQGRKTAAATVTPEPETSEADGHEPGAPVALLDEDDAGPRSLAAHSSAALEREDPFASVPVAEALAHTPSGSPAVDVDDEPAAAPATPATTTAPQNSRLVVIVTVVAIAVLSFVAVYWMSSPDPSSDRPSRGAPGAAGAAASESAARAESGGSANGDAAGKSPQLAVDVPPPAVAEGGDEANAAGDGADAKPPADLGAEADPDTPNEEGDAEGGVAASPTPPPPDDREALIIDQALVDGKLRALDSLLVWPSTNRSMTWSDARKYCRGRRLGELRGWRMATTAELTRLNRSRVVTRGILWSRQRNETGDEAQALDAKSGTFNWYLDVEAAARPACVRKR